MTPYQKKIKEDIGYCLAIVVLDCDSDDKNRFQSASDNVGKVSVNLSMDKDKNAVVKITVRKKDKELADRIFEMYGLYAADRDKNILRTLLVPVNNGQSIGITSHNPTAMKKEDKDAFSVLTCTYSVKNMEIFNGGGISEAADREAHRLFRESHNNHEPEHFFTQTETEKTYPANKEHEKGPVPAAICASLKTYMTEDVLPKLLEAGLPEKKKYTADDICYLWCGLTIQQLSKKNELVKGFMARKEYCTTDDFAIREAIADGCVPNVVLAKKKALIVTLPYEQFQLCDVVTHFLPADMLMAYMDDGYESVFPTNYNRLMRANGNNIASKEQYRKNIRTAMKKFREQDMLSNIITLLQDMETANATGKVMKPVRVPMYSLTIDRYKVSFFLEFADINKPVKVAVDIVLYRDVLEGMEDTKRTIYYNTKGRAYSEAFTTINFRRDNKATKTLTIRHNTELSEKLHRLFSPFSKKDPLVMQTLLPQHAESVASPNLAVPATPSVQKMPPVPKEAPSNEEKPPRRGRKAG